MKPKDEDKTIKELLKWGKSEKEKADHPGDVQYPISEAAKKALKKATKDAQRPYKNPFE